MFSNKIRPGIVLVRIQGSCFLAADKKAREYCPFIREINDIGALIWEGLEKGLAEDAILGAVRAVYAIPEDCDLMADIHTFEKQLSENGYLIREVSENAI